MLIILSGLPGTGKSTIARVLAQRLGAFHLRVDAIEMALWHSELKIRKSEDAGYRACYALAEENLRLGATVIGDTVNPIEVTRRDWRAVAKAVDVGSLEVEVICSDPALHRSRVEARRDAEPQAGYPPWDKVCARHYEPWTTDILRIDSAALDPEASAAHIIAQISR